MELNNSEIENQNYPQLNLPKADLKFRREGDVLKVFDSLRKKYIVLTPEEFVRQHFVNFLIHDRHYPSSIISNEIGIELNGTRKRCDTVVFQRDATPLIIVEYKAPGVNITQDVFDQIVRYNMKLKAKYLIVSNGMNHYCCVVDYDANSYHFIPQIPDYRDVSYPVSDN